MVHYLTSLGIRFCEFMDHGKAMTSMLLDASYGAARRKDRPIAYLASSKEDKEKRALELLGENRVERGLVCVLSCVEPCMTYAIRRNDQTGRPELQYVLGKCLHLYHYYLDPQFGWMNARIQTWFPFSVQVCLNGREWLARKMDQASLKYERYDNSFPWIEDFAKAQRLFNRLLRQDWTGFLDRIARRLNPAARKMFASYPLQYYWTGYQTEWATDIAFRSNADLASIYPQLVWGAITNFSSQDVMRFLGRGYDGRFSGEIVSDFRNRPEGIRVKHQANGNSVKAYDKGPNILRTETTINNPRDLKVYRASETDPGGPKKWRRMRKGVADLRRRAEVCKNTNEHYLDALAKLDTTTRLQDLFSDVSRPRKHNGRIVRPLRVWTAEDQVLLEAINRPEFLIAGFRNRDLAHLLYPGAEETPVSRRRAAARVSYRLRILRAHGLIGKLSSTRRYRITQKGREIATAALTSQQVTVQQLAKAAA
jgi:hypothetical protein